MLYQPSSDDVGDGTSSSSHFLRPKLGSKTYKRGELASVQGSRKRKTLGITLAVILLLGGYFFLYQVQLVGTPPPGQLAATSADDSQLVLDVITRSKLTRLETSLRHMHDENEALKTQLQTLSAESSATNAAKVKSSSNTESIEHRDSLHQTPLSEMKAKMESFRFYCMVPTIFARHRMDKIRAVISTWGRRCDIIKLFIDPAPEGESFPKYFPSDDPEVQVEMVQLPLVRKNDEMQRDKKYTNASCTQFGNKVPCRHIWEKVWRAWDYIYDNDLDKADFFAKIDDDTYFFVEFAKLHFALNDWDPEEPRYFGHVSHQAPKPFVNGAWVGVSRGALKKVVPVYKKMPREYGSRDKFDRNRCVDRDGASQELVEAICMDQVGIPATSITDQYGFEKVNIFRVSDALFLRKRPGTTSWYWYKKPETSVCCSETPIAFHWYKDPSDLERFEKYLYDPKDTYLSSKFFSREIADKLKKNPDEHVPAVISRKSRIPIYVFWDEIHYLWMVRENLRALRP